MRTLILIFSFVSFLSLTTTAQSSFNLEGGLNLSKVKLTNSVIFNPQFEISYFLGVRQNITLSEKVSFNFTLQYTQDGYWDRIVPLFNSPGATQEIEFSYHYFRLIPDVEIHLNSKIGLYAGPNFGASFKEEFRADNGKWIDIGEDKFIENVDFGVRLGARYHMKKFTITANYSHGFSKFQNFSETDASGNDIGLVDQRLRSIQIGVGFALVSG